MWPVAAGWPVTSPDGRTPTRRVASDEWSWQQTPDNAVAHMTTRGPHGLAATQHAVEACLCLPGRLTVCPSLQRCNCWLLFKAAVAAAINCGLVTGRRKWRVSDSEMGRALLHPLARWHRVIYWPTGNAETAPECRRRPAGPSAFCRPVGSGPGHYFH